MTPLMKALTEIVAIDGPAGAGKSTVAKRVAQALDFAFLDTGAMYRAATWWALDQAVDLDDPNAVAAAIRAMPLDLHEENGALKVIVAGRDITEAIRSPEVTRQIHKLDENPQVREHLVELQRAYAARGPTVAEGRDMGTVVFPKAKVKVFLDASLDERARRRAAELASKGIKIDQDRIRAEIHERDEQNRRRKTSPLRQAEGAVRIDTTHLTIDEAVDAVVRLARKAR